MHNEYFKIILEDIDELISQIDQNVYKDRLIFIKSSCLDIEQIIEDYPNVRLNDRKHWLDDLSTVANYLDRSINQVEDSDIVSETRLVVEVGKSIVRNVKRVIEYYSH